MMRELPHGDARAPSKSTMLTTTAHTKIVNLVEDDTLQERWQPALWTWRSPGHMNHTGGVKSMTVNKVPVGSLVYSNAICGTITHMLNACLHHMHMHRWAWHHRLHVSSSICPELLHMCANVTSQFGNLAFAPAQPRYWKHVGISSIGTMTSEFNAF